MFKERKYIQLFSLVCGFLLSLNLIAQQQISGYVWNEKNNQPVADATIKSLNNDKEVTTDENGYFSIELKEVPDNIIVSSSSFLPKKWLVRDSTPISIYLNNNFSSLREVVITGGNPPEFEIMKIDLNTIPVNTAQDLLRKVPGLFIAQHAGGGKAEQIFLRGFDNDHGTDIRISADGIPVNMVSHAHGQGYSDLHFLIPETVENIEFGKGAYYADKGDFNTSGYVDFHTYNKLPTSQVKIEGGMFSTYRVAAMATVYQDTVNNRNAYLAGEYNYTNGAFVNPQNFKRVNFMGKYSGKIGKHDFISILASTFSSNWNASGQIPTRAIPLVGRFGSIDKTEGGNTSRTNVALTYQRHINTTTDLQSTFYYSKYKFQLFSDFTFFLVHPTLGDEIMQSDDRDVYGMDHKITKKYNLKHADLKLIYGAGFRYDDIHKIELAYVTAQQQLNEILALGSANETNINAFISTEWKMGKFMINPALRFDVFNFSYKDQLTNTGYQFPVTKYVNAGRPSPKLNFFYNPSNKLQLFLKTGMGFHSNDVRVVILQKGASTLPYSIGGDLGTVIRPTKGLIIMPTLWYTYLQNEFIWNGDSYGVTAIGSTQRFGLDLSFRYQPLPWLYFDVDANLAHPRVLGLPEGENYVPLAPTLTSTGGVSVKTKKGFMVNLRYRYMHNRPGNEDNSLTASGYFVNDLIIGYQPKKWGVSMQIQNLFNVNWKEATFATTSRLQGEPSQGITDIAFTPGTPFYLKLAFTYKF